MKKLGFGKRALACAVSAATLLTATTALSAGLQLGGTTASAASTDNYAKLLQYSMYFYDGNMCGNQVGETSLFNWRDDCHTSDSVEGGFHDAGDHVKFGLPAGYTASTLGWGYYEFKDAYDSLGQTAHLKTITDYFAKFFKDSTTLSGDTVTSFVYQVGDGDMDHADWCAPEVQSAASRKIFTTTNGASDIAAEYAAALAVNYINFGNTEDLTYAKALYEFSIQNKKVTDEGTSNFYNSFDYYDDQAWAAGWLYLATNDSAYSTFLNQFMNDSNAGKSGMSGCKWGVYSPHSWNNVSLGAAILQGEITGAAADWAKVNTYLASKCNGSGYYCEDAWGSCRYNAAMQLAALAANKHYAQIDFNSWCKSQMAMILGDNPIHTNFVVGFDSNSAKYAHHRAASGYSSYDEMNNSTTYSSNGHTLVGALVGGPSDANFTYTDSVNDYKCNEVALDYNAGLVGAAAGLYALYGTGSLESSIEGAEVNSNPVVTTEATTTSRNVEQTTTTTNSGNSGLGENDKLAILVPGTETGDDGNLYKYVEFSTNGAVSATAYFTSSSNDMEASVAFGTWNGDWAQNDSKVAISAGKEVAIDYDVPSDVGSTVKFMVFYPSADNVEISKVVLHYGGSVTTERTTATSRTNKETTTTTTTVTTSGGGGQQAEVTLGSEIGDDGTLYKYAEFRPNGAKTATAHFDVTSNDLNASVSFGTWNGEWVQADYDVVITNGKASVTYEIPSNVGSTVKFSVYYPGASSVGDISIVLDESGATGNVTTTNNNNTSSSSGKYSIELNERYTYSDMGPNDKMIGWEWAKFGIPDNETIQKVVVNLSTRMSEIGKWQGAFGSSTSVEPDYWTQTDDMEMTISAKTGSITWEIDPATAAIIQTKYQGELKFGVWWIDCDSFDVTSIDVYTDAYQGGSGNVTTQPPQTTSTTAKTTVTTSATTTTSASQTTTTASNHTTAQPLPEPSIYGDVNMDGTVNLSDAILLNKYVASVVMLSDRQLANADVCTDSGIGMNDSIVLLRFLVRLTATIPSAD